MKLAQEEIARVRTLGLYITERCDGCGKVLNQCVRYTITGRLEVYCSAQCRDTAFFGSTEKAEKHSRPGRCAFCGGSLADKRRGALYCNPKCRIQDSRLLRNAASPNNANSAITESAVYAA
jgi:phage FluMu protein Com